MKNILIATAIALGALCTSARAQFSARSSTPKVPGIATPGSGGFLMGADNCATPHTSAGTGNQSAVPFTTGSSGSTGQSAALCYAFGATGITNDVWFGWTATSTGNATMSFCGGTSIDTKVAAWPDNEPAGCPAAGTSFACNDESCGLQSSITWAVTSGTIYTLQVGTFPGAAGGSGTFSITQSALLPCGQFDGGSTENAFGLTSGGEIGWIHVFNCVTAGANITGGRTAYGTLMFPGSVTNGNNSKIALYDDTDNDLNPTTGLVLLRSLNTTVMNGDTDILNPFVFATTVTRTGASTTVLLASADQVAGEFPGPMDESAYGPEAWVVGNTYGPGTLNITNLNNNSFPPVQMQAIGYPAYWLLRMDIRGGGGCVAPEILGQPENQTVDCGDPATFRVLASGTGPLHYQWYHDFALIPGANAAQYTIPSTDPSDAGTYFVEIWNDCGAVTSNLASLTIGDPCCVPAEIMIPPQSQIVEYGDAVSFQVVATGDPPLVYQWFHDGTAIGGATASIYTIPTADFWHEGEYTVRVRNDCGEELSQPATLVVEPGSAFSMYEIPGSCQRPIPAMSSCSGAENPTGGFDPVYLFSGEVYHSAVDLRIPGRGIDFVWARKYRSRLGPSTPQGNGWDFSYNKSVEIQGRYALVRDGNTRVDVFAPDGVDLWGRDGMFQELRREPDGFFVLTYPDRSECHFLPEDDFFAPGKLFRIRDRNGNEMSFVYNSQGRLIRIRDTLYTATNPREINIVYTAQGRIQSVTDWVGRQVRYEYYQSGEAGGSAGDLKSVTTPAVVPNADFPFPDRPEHRYDAGKTTVYTYSTGSPVPELNGNLLTITDPKGQTYVRNEYSPFDSPRDVRFDRIVRQTLGDPGDVLDVTYTALDPTPPNNQAVLVVIVNDRVGNVGEFYFDALNRCVIEREYTGRADPDLPTTLTTNRPVGKLRAEDPKFFETRRLFNDDHLLTLVDHPNGNRTQNNYDEANLSRMGRGNLLYRSRAPGSHSPGGDQALLEEFFEYLEGPGGCCGTSFVTRYIDPRSNATEHEYDANANRTRTIHSIPSIVEDFAYNQWGQRTAHVLPHNGNGSGHRRRDELRYSEDPSDSQYGYLREEVVDAGFENLTTTSEYDRVGNLVRVTDPGGDATDFQVNQLGQVVLEILPEVSPGSGVRYQREHFYDPNENLVRVDVQNVVDQVDLVEGNTHLTTIREYEGLNQLIRECQEVGSYEGPIPGSAHVPTCAGLPEAEFATTEHEYDANRNRVLIRKGEAVEGRQPGNVVRTSYDERDLVFRVTRGGAVPGGSSVEPSTDQFDYDGNGNLVRERQGIEDALNPRVAIHVYDGYGRRVSSADPMGNVTSRHFDDNGNMLSERTDGELSDAPGALANVRLQEVRWVYDPMDRRTTQRILFFDPLTQSQIDDGESTTETVLSDVSQVLAVNNDNGHVTTTHYDTANRVQTVSDAKGNAVEYIYDNDSLLIALIENDLSDDPADSPEVFLTTFAYDGLDRETDRADHANNVVNTSSFRYDSRNNRTLAIDALLTQTRRLFDGIDRVIETVYDLDADGADGDVLDIRILQGWDDSSRLVSKTDGEGNTTDYEYDELDRQTESTNADGIPEHYKFDVHSDLVRGTDPNETTVVQVYDRSSRLIHRAVESFGAGVSQDTTFEDYAYDGLARLRFAVDDDSQVARDYDSLSNLTRETQNGQVLLCEHDGLGNRTRTDYPGGRVIACTYDELERKEGIIDQTSAPWTVASYQYVGDRVRHRTYTNGVRTTTPTMG